MTPREVRVLHVLPHLHRIGNGIVDVTVDLALAQAGAGLRVAVAAAGGEYEELLRSHGVTRLPLTVGPGGLRPLRRIIREFRPTIVHTHTLKGLALSRLAFPGVPILNTAHRDLGRFCAAMVMADRVIAVSEGIAATLRSYVRPGRIRVVRNGVLGGPRRRDLLDVPPAVVVHPAVVYVGGIYEHKGVAVLLRAFARLREQGRDLGAVLYVVGDGPDRERFLELGRSLGLGDRVQWLGFRRDAYAWIRSADVFVLPSLQETFGLVLAEARQAGVAIVATATGGVPETVDGGRAGRLVAPGDVTALADAVHRLLADDEQRTLLGAAGAENTEWLTVERMHREVLREYEDLLSA